MWPNEVDGIRTDGIQVVAMLGGLIYVFIEQEYQKHKFRLFSPEQTSIFPSAV